MKTNLQPILKFWTQRMFYVLTGEMDKTKSRQLFNEKFRSVQVNFSKTSIFTKKGKQNIIQKIKNSQHQSYYYIPTASESPFHFSISIPSGNDYINSGRKTLYIIIYYYY